jgi:NAD+ kinase
MALIGLVIRPGIKKALTAADEVVQWAAKNGHRIVFEERSAGYFGEPGTGFHPERLIAECEPIVTLGGDGTLIGIARHTLEQKQPTIIGVNFGNLGFLTEIAPDELLPTLDAYFAGRVSLAERAMLRAEVIRSGQTVFASQAVNDAIVQKGSRDRLLDLDFAVDAEDVMRVRGDGLILATPTGSTAYSLAAGGTIAHPGLNVLLVTPICPHSLTVRPFMLSMDSVCRISIPPYDGRVYLSVDGQVSTPLQAGDVVRVTKSPNRVHFVRSSHRSYFDILRVKLNWGIGNSAE